MASVIRFSEFELYLKDLARRPDHNAGAFLDTNILVSMSYEIKKDHEPVLEILDIANEAGIRFYATVTTKSEFIEFRRRLLMTEALIDMADPHSKVRLTRAARAAIHSATATMRAAVKRGSDPVFSDTQLKSIKRAFSAGEHSGSWGWLKVCHCILAGKLEAIESYMLKVGITYLSPHALDDSVFTSVPEWSQAIKISEATNVSIGDSMILNALGATRCPFIISLDFDMGYAVLGRSIEKDVVMPDTTVNEYRYFHFS